MRKRGDGETTDRLDEALETIRTAVDRLTTALGHSPPRLVPRPLVAERLLQPESWVERETAAGRLPFAKRLGPRKYVYDAAGLDEYIRNLESAGR